MAKKEIIYINDDGATLSGEIESDISLTGSSIRFYLEDTHGARHIDGEPVTAIIAADGLSAIWEYRIPRTAFADEGVFNPYLVATLADGTQLTAAIYTKTRIEFRRRGN